MDASDFAAALYDYRQYLWQEAQRLRQERDALQSPSNCYSFMLLFSLQGPHACFDF